MSRTGQRPRRYRQGHQQGLRRPRSALGRRLLRGPRHLLRRQQRPRQAAENIENKAIDGQRRRNLSQFSAPMAFMAAKR